MAEKPLWDITINRDRWINLAGRIKPAEARWNERLKILEGDGYLSGILKNELIYLPDQAAPTYFTFPEITGSHFTHTPSYPISRVGVGPGDGRRRNIGSETVGGDSLPMDTSDIGSFGEFVPLSFNQIGEIIASRLGVPAGLRGHTVSQPRIDFKAETKRVGTGIRLKTEALERIKRREREKFGKQKGEMPKRGNEWTVTTPQTQEDSVAAPRPKARIIAIRDTAASLRQIKDGTTYKASRWLGDYFARYYDTKTNYITHAKEAAMVDETSFRMYNPADVLESILGSSALELALKLAQEAKEHGEDTYVYYFLGGEMRKNDLEKCIKIIQDLARVSTWFGFAEFVSPRPVSYYPQLYDHLPFQIPQNMRVRRSITEENDVWPTLSAFHRSS